MSFNIIFLRQAAEFNQCRVEVNQLNDLCTVLSLSFWYCNDEGNTNAQLIQRISFRPFAFFTKMISVIAKENDNGVLSQIIFLQGIHHTANLCIHKTGG